nr:AAA family ATPase [Clostridia bacterium]
MRLLRVTIKKYKNLEDFDCVFPDSNIAAFIGNNGSGKSNLLEAISEAFSYAKNRTTDKAPWIVPTPDLKECKIQYEYDHQVYLLECDGADISISFDGKRLNKSGMEAVLPETIMLYYAGETRRQSIKAQRTFDDAYIRKLKATSNDTFPGFKYLDYYSLQDLPLLLITAYAYQGEYYNKLLSLLNCKNIQPQVSFLLRNPTRSKGSADTYWNARGFVKSFLDECRKFVSSTADQEDHYLMMFDDIGPINTLASNESELFAKLKAIQNAGYLQRVLLSFTHNNGSEVPFDELSEGEKQLSLLLLLTSFTANSNVLYLFDEFDAYMHLNWQKAFGKMLTEIDVNGYILFTSHSPATISGMQKKNVFIMTEGKASSAPSETYNRSLDEIMEEHMLVSMRPKEYIDLEQEFRNAVIHGRKDFAEEALIKIREIVGENDPFFITARIVLNRME